MKNSLGQPIDIASERLRSIIEQAEASFKANNLEKCIELLAPHRSTLEEYGRRLLVTSVLKSEKWDLVIEITDPPQSIEELVARVTAYLRKREFARAREALQSNANSLNIDTIMKDALLERIRDEEAIG